MLSRLVGVYCRFVIKIYILVYRFWSLYIFLYVHSLLNLCHFLNIYFGSYQEGGLPAGGGGGVMGYRINSPTCL